MGHNETVLHRYQCRILYEDETLLVLSKPANLLVIPDRFDTTAPNLYHILLSVYSSIFVVHRLDKDTSGVLLFAKTAESHKALSLLFEQRLVTKQYTTIVEGESQTPEGTISLPLREVHGKVFVHPEGKESTTNYKVLEQFHGFSLLEVQPLTGRLHQIRAHLKAIGLPILGDPVYGVSSAFYLSSIKHSYRGKENEKPLIARTALHASMLSFEHPFTHKHITFQSPIPKDMESTLKALRKYAVRSSFLSRS